MKILIDKNNREQVDYYKKIDKKIHNNKLDLIKAERLSMNWIPYTCGLRHLVTKSVFKSDFNKEIFANILAKLGNRVYLSETIQYKNLDSKFNWIQQIY